MVSANGLKTKYGGKFGWLMSLILNEYCLDNDVLITNNPSDYSIPMNCSMI